MESKAITDWKRKIAYKREKERIRLQKKKEDEREKILNILKGKHERLEPFTIESKWSWDIEERWTKQLADEITKDIDKQIIDYILIDDVLNEVEPMGSTEIILNQNKWKKN